MATLDELIKQSLAKLATMTPEEKEAMYRQQRDGYVKAEMSWPRSNYHWENGVKVYHSYEDYCND